MNRNLKSATVKKTLKTAFVSTVPVMTGYLVLGFGFGIVLKSAGYGIPFAARFAICFWYRLYFDETLD